MTTEVAPLQSVQDTIKDRIKSEFANLIPDEMWQRMVESVVKDFTTDKHDSYRGHAESPMKTMIRTEIEAIAKAKIKDELENLAAPDWDRHGQMVVSEALKKMIAENFATILGSVQQGMVEMIVQNTVAQIRNNMSRF